MEDKDNKSVSQRNDFSYREVETFGQMMLSLPNICNDQAAMDMSTPEVVHQLVRVASEFDAEWVKLTDEEHDELHEDWLEEVDKLARWVKDHLYDVLHNELEYGMYRARRRVWGYSIYQTGCGTSEIWVSADRNDALSLMLGEATYKVGVKMSSAPIHFEYWDKTCDSDALPSATVRIGDQRVEYRLISKLKED